MEEKKLTEESYFTFRLGSGLFALPVTAVREVLNYSVITPVPNSLPYLKGVMNIRGSVVTVVDFRSLFGFESQVDDAKASVIVTEVAQENEAPLIIAVLADAVDQVNRLELVQSDTVAYGTLDTRRDFVKAVGRKDGQFVLLLDIEKVMQSVEKELDTAQK